MQNHTTLYENLAALLQYPRGDFRRLLQSSQELAEASVPEAAALLADFNDQTRGLSPTEMEELYVGTFDFSSAGALEIGWHLFGEDYQRGAFLVKMREELRRLGIPESPELPDHLTHVLLILAKSEGPAADELALQCALPALDKIIAAIEDNPYARILQAVRATLSRYHKNSPQGIVHG
jgi:nitrate reductase delta subunit